MRAWYAVLGIGAFVAASASPLYAQDEGLGGFSSIHASSIESNARTGDFTIPAPFTASRRGIEISGDRAFGNASSKTVTVDGHIVVHIAHAISLAGETAGSQGPSTLWCDHLQADAFNRRYHATGNVRYVQGERSVTADAADLDEASNHMQMEGHVAVAGTGTSGMAGGFDSLKTAAITSDSSAGDFTIPGRFQAKRQGVEISGDHAHGNTHRNQLFVIGNVVVKTEKRSGTLTCEILRIDETLHAYRATGNVRYAEPSRTLSADAADMNEKTHILHMQGHVHVTDTSKGKK